MLLFCLSLSLIAIHKASAAIYDFKELKYQPLAPIEGVRESGAGGGVDLGQYLGDIFKLGIGLCGVFAVLMIVIGGLEYTMTEKVASKEDAKSRISGAIVGLLLALSSYIILYTINPDLVKLNFLNKLNTATSKTSSGDGNTLMNAKGTSMTGPDGPSRNPGLPQKPGDPVII